MTNRSSLNSTTTVATVRRLTLRFSGGPRSGPSAATGCSAAHGSCDVPQDTLNVVPLRRDHFVVPQRKRQFRGRQITTYCRQKVPRFPARSLFVDEQPPFCFDPAAQYVLFLGSEED